ncbi:MAG: hypothetical protein AAGA71_22185, partial [Pseudomonadota bacterium]
LKRPIHRSGLGIMLLSLKQEAEIGRLVRRYNSEMTDPTETRAEPAEVQQMAADATRQGWFKSSNLVTHGGGSIATLLRPPRAHTTLAVGFGLPVSLLSEKEDALREVLLRHVAQFQAGALSGS